MTPRPGKLGLYLNLALYLELGVESPQPTFVWTAPPPPLHSHTAHTQPKVLPSQHLLHRASVAPTLAQTLKRKRRKKTLRSFIRLSCDFGFRTRKRVRQCVIYEIPPAAAFPYFQGDVQEVSQPRLDWSHFMPTPASPRMEGQKNNNVDREAVGRDLAVNGNFSFRPSWGKKQKKLPFEG